jgi:ABC-type Fe3+/spermidine/putrescine transport system ATPase subunit
MVLLGESGSGKSTLLRIVAGLERPERGSIAMLGSDQSSVPAHRRPIAWMSQAAGCYEQLSVSENLSIAQRMVDSSAAITRENALAWREELVDGLKLGPLLDREPSSISGGERQRVALARSLLSMRPILLLDEPLAHLNESMRELVGGQLRRWTHRMGTSVLWVTHDSLEAAELADRMALMVDGGIEQVGAPKNIIADPASDRAAELVVRLRRFRSVHLGL